MSYARVSETTSDFVARAGTVAERAATRRARSAKLGHRASKLTFMVLTLSGCASRWANRHGATTAPQCTPLLRAALPHQVLKCTGTGPGARDRASRTGRGKAKPREAH